VKSNHVANLTDADRPSESVKAIALYDMPVCAVHVTMRCTIRGDTNMPSAAKTLQPTDALGYL